MENNNTEEVVKEVVKKKKLRKLNPKQKLFVKYYTTPSSETFAHIHNSYKRAGFTSDDTGNSWHLTKRPAVQHAIQKATVYNGKQLNDLNVSTIQGMFSEFTTSDNESIRANAQVKILDYWTKLIELKYKYGYGNDNDYENLSPEDLLKHLKSHRDEIDVLVRELEGDNVIEAEVELIDQ